MAGPVKVECPVCHVLFPVPSEVVGVDEQANTVVVRMDRSGLYGHVAECAAKAGDQAGEALNTMLGGNVSQPAKALEAKATSWVSRVADADLRGRITQLLAILERAGHYTSGNRACTMCGATYAACMVSLDKTERTSKLSPKRVRVPGSPCCPSCGEGNTHPSGGERTGCAEWAGEHGAQD